MVRIHLVFTETIGGPLVAVNKGKDWVRARAFLCDSSRGQRSQQSCGKVQRTEEVIKKHIIAV